MLFFVVYVSSAVRAFNEEEVRKLVEVSRRINAALDITGLLLHKNGNFMQFLEGPKKNVMALMEKIKKDPRHRGFITLLQQYKTEREFPECPMDFRQIEQQEPLHIPGYSNFLDLPLTSEQFLLNPSKSVRLLLNFKQMVTH